jgi:hypothetical protein
MEHHHQVRARRLRAASINRVTSWTVRILAASADARIQSVVAIAFLIAMPALLAQTPNPSPPELLNIARPLTTTEIATVLDASRQALTAKTFRLSIAPRGQGPEVLMGPAGRPKIIRTTYRIVGGVVGGIVGGVVSGTPGGATRSAETRWQEDFTNIVDYTGRPARRCDGSAEHGEMVIEYVHRSTTHAWTATARTRSARDVGGPRIARMFEMLLDAAPLTSGVRRQIGDRWARALVSSWTPPRPDARSEAPLLTGDPMPNVAGDPMPDDATQSLWIDTASLLPLRWEVSERGRLTYGIDITHESIDLRPPAGVDAPECIR